MGLACAVELQKDPHQDVIGVKQSGCHGLCSMGPLVRIEPEGYLYMKVSPEDCREIIETTVLGGEPVERLAYKKNGVVYAKQESIPFYLKQQRIMLKHCGHIDATQIDEYLAVGGYKAF